MRTWSFAKGHGTGNDFVIVLDRHGMSNPSPEAVRFLCDRHRGIGGDGLLRVVPGRLVPGWTDETVHWFMDYRNADGSLAQMCGNGARVFARYLLEQDLITGSAFRIGTRAGVKEVNVGPTGQIRVGMGMVTTGREVVIEHGGRRWPSVAADVGNPHAVALVDDGELAALDLGTAPRWTPAETFPEGVNIEFVSVVDDTTARMRVHERGVGETQSCGTGTVAVAAVLGRERPDAHARTVHVPGGTVRVDLGELTDGGREAWLTGPAVIVAQGEVQIPDEVPALATTDEPVSVSA